MNILVAIDGSAASVKAIDYVVARKRRGEKFDVSIINVQPALRAHGGVITPAMVKEFQQDNFEKAFAAVATQAKYLKADCYSEIGDAAEHIIGFVRKSKSDEIVMGSRGLGGVKGLLLGSVVSKVVQLSPVPVVVVK
jgi:nucleotide-binding universal stress UspA family protein